MKRKIKTTDERIEDLAVMIQRGFTETASKTELHAVEERLNERLDRIEFHANTHERRIEILEDKVQMIGVKIGLKK